MEKNNLISLLKTFDRKEMTRFKDFALSPYHHKHKETQTLILYFNKIFPHFKKKNCERRLLWAKLFPDKTFNNASLALLFTYAWRLAEQFLVQERLSLSSNFFNLGLLYELRDKKQWAAYDRQWEKSKDLLQKDKKKDATHYRYTLDLAEEANQLYIQQAHRRKDFSLIEKEQILDQYYILEKLRDAVEMQVRRQILQGDYSARLLEAVLLELSKNPATYQKSPAIQIYFLLYKMMDQPSLPAYKKTLKVFQEHESVFSFHEVAGIYIYLQNFCISRINKNEKGFLREVFNLYQDQLERQLLHEDGSLIEWHYKNIVTTAIRLNELEWTITFIEAYKSQLKAESAENAYRFNKAAYCYAVGDFDQVLSLLTHIEYSDFRYNMGAKVLLLRVYYEVNEFEALDALVESFRQYLQRNSLMADSVKKGIYHVFRITRRMAKIKSSIKFILPDKAEQIIKKLRMDINETKAVFNRAWLEAKIEDLEKELSML